MNLNIQKAKIFVEERLSIVQYAGMWSEVKTRYGTSLVYTNERWPDSTIVKREFKISFNTKTVTIAEKFKGAWVQVHEISEKACADFPHVCNLLINFTPKLSPTDGQRADRRIHEAVQALTGSTGGDVAVTVSAGASKAPCATSELVKPPSPKGRSKFLAGKKNAPVERKEIVVEDAGTAVVEGKELPVVKFTETKAEPELLESGGMNFTPADFEQSVSRARRESPHKIVMQQMVNEVGIPFEKVPSKHGVSYLFEGISITFSGTMLKVAALTEWDDRKDGDYEKAFPIFTTWLSGKYEHDQINVLKDVLVICKETARLRAMACFNIPEVSFSHSECNFITDKKESVHYRARTHYISINYRVDGYNHDGFAVVQVKSIRYNREDLIPTEGKKGRSDGLLTEKALTAVVTYNKTTDLWNSRYWNAAKPTKKMTIECEEVSYTTNRELLMSFGQKIPAETREKEFYTVHVPLDQVPVK